MDEKTKELLRLFYAHYAFNKVGCPVSEGIRFADYRPEMWVNLSRRLVHALTTDAKADLGESDTCPDEIKCGRYSPTRECEINASHDGSGGASHLVIPSRDGFSLVLYFGRESSGSVELVRRDGANEKGLWQGQAHVEILAWEDQFGCWLMDLVYCRIGWGPLWADYSIQYYCEGLKEMFSVANLPGQRSFCFSSTSARLAPFHFDGSMFSFPGSDLRLWEEDVEPEDRPVGWNSRWRW